MYIIEGPRCRKPVPNPHVDEGKGKVKTIANR